ncbi:MAG: hypothetical protein M1365_09745, partial [Actinobacteria bacterium]|nr:hypothetical protein [Actinomycetota bacterium]
CANFSFRGAGIGHIFNILDNGNLDFRVSPGGDPSSANSALFIANNGNIGIGTTNPTAKLEIAGTTSTISNSSGNLTISSVSNLILSPTGNAGIGTTLPGLKLDVQDSQAATSAAQIFNTNTGVDADGLIVKLGNNSTSVVNSTNHFISFETSGIGIIGSIQGNGGKGLTYATNGVADFAEYLPKDENEDIPFGSIVCLGTDGKVHPCQGGTFTVAGVTSGNPAFLGGKNQGNASIPVALVGQVIVFVSNKNGAINAGDKITISDIPGVGVKATKLVLKICAAVGRALEPFNGTLGKIMVLVNISESTGLAYEQMDNLFMFKMAENGKTLFVDSKGNEVVSFDENGNATFKGSIEANKISANQIEGLTVLTNELITDKISKVAGASTSDQASTSSQSAVLSKLLNRDNNISILADLIVDQNATVNLNMNVLGKLAVEKGIIVSGPAKFKDETIFEKLVTFISKVVFKDDVKFDGTATFNKDTAGTAIVRKGADTVEIIFEKEFKNTPIITASVILDKENDQEKQKQTEQVTLGSDAKYVLANRNSKGFTIKLNNPTKIDMQFSWTAFSIDNPTTFESKPVVTPTVIPIISITPETQIASPSATN